MLSFKEFHGSGLTRHDGGAYSHKTHIDGHHVEVFFARYGTRPRRYEVAFSVNQSFSKNNSSNQMEPHVGNKIMHFVGHAVDNFVGKVKPRALRMTASDSHSDTKDSKERAYHAFAKRISKKYAGIHKTFNQGFTDSNTEQIEFPLHNDQKPDHSFIPYK